MRRKKFGWTTWTDYGSEINELLWRYAWHEELTWSENLTVMEIMIKETEVAK